MSDARAAHPAGTAVLERPQIPGDDGPIRLHLVDDRESPVIVLADTRTRELLDTIVEFTVKLPGRPCAVTLDDNGEPLYRFPKVGPPVKPGDVVRVHLPAFPL